MAFEARVYVQGAGNCIPHAEGGKSLLVLFPKQSLFEEHRSALPPFPTGARSRRGDAGYDDVCPHHPIVHLDRRHLEGDPGGYVEDPEWEALPLADEWVGIETDSEIPMKLPAEGVPGTPSIERLLDGKARDAAGFDPSLLPTPGSPDPPLDRIAAGLHLNAGKVSPVSEYEAPFMFRPIRSVHEDLPRSRTEEIYSGVLKVELGRVTTAHLLRRRFGEEKVEKVRLHPIGDELNLWVRHVCERDGKLTKPGNEESASVDKGSVDTDFVLNYLLRADVSAFLEEVKGDLPMPRITTTWLRGGPIGSDLVRCMRVAEAAAPFESPF